MTKITSLIFYILLLVGCNQSNNNNSSKTDISPTDTCQKIQLGDSLYLGFHVNMTSKEYNKQLDSLLAKKVINSKDTSIIIYLPYLIESPMEFKLSVIPFYNGCHLYMIRLAGWTSEPNALVYEIDKLMIEKYGKGVENGYNQGIVDNGRVIDGIYGAEYMLAQMKPGEAIIGVRRKENDVTSGKRRWNVNGVEIVLTYQNDRIEIEYQSLNYLKQEKNKKVAERKTRDSLNKIKINSSIQSF